MLQKVMIQPSAARRCALLSLHRTRCMHVCPVRGKGSRRQTRRRGRRCRGRSRSAAWKGGNGGILLLDVDFASFTFIPQTERTNERTAFAVSLSSSSKQLTNIFFTILVDCCAATWSGLETRAWEKGILKFSLPVPIFRGLCHARALLIGCRR